MRKPALYNPLYTSKKEENYKDPGVGHPLILFEGQKRDKCDYSRDPWESGGRYGDRHR